MESIYSVYCRFHSMVSSGVKPAVGDYTDRSIGVAQPFTEEQMAAAAFGTHEASKKMVVRTKTDVENQIKRQMT